jgi:hypothetical protein
VICRPGAPFASGPIGFTPRLDHDRQCILVLIGADADGRKELLAIEDGYRESTPALQGLLALSLPGIG